MKTALITGSTSGIGQQIGLDLLDKNYFVYFNGHTQESTKELEKEIEYRDINTDYLPTFNIICQDLSTIDLNIQLANWFIKNGVFLDIIVLNLGITDRTPFGKIEPEAWNRVFETNLSGGFFLLQALRNRIRPNGRIIFISSILSKIPHGTSISYAVSKAAINAIIPYLAKEFKDRKITVNAICPGFIEGTNWHINKSKKQIKKIEQKILLKRFGTRKEISNLVLEIINNSYINGTVIDITGGYNIK